MLEPLATLYETVHLYLESYTTARRLHFGLGQAHTLAPLQPFLVDLMRWYGDAVVPERAIFRDSADGRFLHRLGFAPALLNGSLGAYEAVFFIRPDMIFKEGVVGAALTAANRSQFLFASQEWPNMQCGCASMCNYCLMRWADDAHTRLVGDYSFTGSGRKRVVDTLAWVPAWAFQVFTQPERCAAACTEEHKCPGCGSSCTEPTDCLTTFLNEHRAMDSLAPLLGEENVGFLLPRSQHDSDPSKDANPLYRFAGRSEQADLESVTSTYDWWQGGTVAI